MFTLTLVDLEFEKSVSVWEFEMMIVLKWQFAFISDRYTIKFTNQNSLRFRVWRIIIFITWWSHKRQTFTLISINKMRIWKFFLQITGYLNTRKSFPIYMFIVMASGKCDLHIHFTFLQEFYSPHIRKNWIFFSNNICRDAQQSIFRSR